MQWVAFLVGRWSSPRNSGRQSRTPTPPWPVPSPAEIGGGLVRRASNPSAAKKIQAKETTNKLRPVEKRNSDFSLVTDTLMLSSVFSPKNKTYIGTWNVRTLNWTGNLAQLLREFDNYGMDILGVSEVCWLGNGRMCSEDKRMLFSCHEEKHERGVGLIPNEEATNALIGWKPVSDRMISARFLSRHAPTEDADDEVKNGLYEQLQDTLDEASRRDIKIILGEFNAQMGGDRYGFERTIGPFASATRFSDNGEGLASSCDHNELCVGNTYFQHRRIHKKTWSSPDKITFTEIDHVCISRKWRTSLQDVRVYRGADIGSDHYLVRAAVKIKLMQQRKITTARAFAVEKLRDPALTVAFKLELRNRFSLLNDVGSLEEEWTDLKETIRACAEKIAGRRRVNRREQWIQDRTWQEINERRRMKPLKEQARTVEELNEVSRKYSELDRMVKKSCRRSKKNVLYEKETRPNELQIVKTQGPCFVL